MRSTKIWFIMEPRGTNNSRKAQRHSPSERHRSPIIPCIFWTLSCQNIQARSVAQLFSTAPPSLSAGWKMLIIRKGSNSCISMRQEAATMLKPGLSIHKGPREEHKPPWTWPVPCYASGTQKQPLSPGHLPFEKEDSALYSSIWTLLLHVLPRTAFHDIPQPLPISDYQNQKSECPERSSYSLLQAVSLTVLVIPVQSRGGGTGSLDCKAQTHSDAAGSSLQILFLLSVCIGNESKSPKLLRFHWIYVLFFFSVLKPL